MRLARKLSAFAGRQLGKASIFRQQYPQLVAPQRQLQPSCRQEGSEAQLLGFTVASFANENLPEAMARSCLSLRPAIGSITSLTCGIP